MKLRSPTTQELRLLKELVAKAPDIKLGTDWQTTIQVQPMNDGGMGSLRLFVESRDDVERTFSCVASECQFMDADGTQVLASLNLDQFQQLFELDIWKVDFSPLIRISATLGN